MVISILYPPTNPSSGRSRKQSVYAIVHSDRGRVGEGIFNGWRRDRERGGRDRQGRVRRGRVGCVGVRGVYENGIDI